VPCSKTQQANLLAYLHTIPFYAERQAEKLWKCKYQLLKSFGLTRPENWTQVYRLRGGCFNHAPVWVYRNKPFIILHSKINLNKLCKFKVHNSKTVTDR